MHHSSEPARSDVIQKLTDDAIFELSLSASEEVRKWLGQYFSRDVLDRLRFEGLLLPFFFEARRIGDVRGQKRAENAVAGLFPGTE